MNELMKLRRKERGKQTKRWKNAGSTESGNKNKSKVRQHRI